MSRVLVTGADTALGRHLVRALREDPAVEHVVAVATTPEAAGRGRLDAEGFTWLAADLTRFREIHDLVFGAARRLGVDTVVHTALHVPARNGGARVHALAVESTRELLRLSEGQPGLRRFVFWSHGDVYRIDASRPVFMAEDHPLDLSPHAPERVRARVEADVTVCTRMGLSRLRIVVLRFSEILAAGVGSQLYDYLMSKVCFRPLGFDPMLNLLSPNDAARAVCLATGSEADGVFNVPGADTLPLSQTIRKWGRLELPVPGPLLRPLYGARSLTLGREFRYDMNYRRFHFSAVLDGRRAREELGYVPRSPLVWPRR